MWAGGRTVPVTCGCVYSHRINQKSRVFSKSNASQFFIEQASIPLVDVDLDLHANYIIRIHFVEKRAAGECRKMIFHIYILLKCGTTACSSYMRANAHTTHTLTHARTHARSRMKDASIEFCLLHVSGRLSFAQIVRRN